MVLPDDKHCKCTCCGSTVEKESISDWIDDVEGIFICPDCGEVAETN